VFLQIFFGPQTHDSVTTKSLGYFIPWTQWRFVRHTLYTPEGKHFYTDWEKNRSFGLEAFNKMHSAREAVPKVRFLCADYDGELVNATCYIEQREWHFGTGWFKWLSWFKSPLIRTSLDIQYDKEVGDRKGSWKGGTIGTSIDMEMGEPLADVFKRHCENNRLTFINPESVI